jgi:alpha-1,2-mannosyltransferase
MIVLTIFISLFLFSVACFPLLLRIAGQCTGWCILRLSRQRRADLLERAAREEEVYASKQQQESSTEDDDWETVDRERVGVAINGGKADKEWKGVIGFFHPFWCVAMERARTVSLLRLDSQ